MLLEGQLSELVVLVEPKMYREYVTYYSSGVPMLYMRMQKGPVQIFGISFIFLQAAKEKVGG